MPQNLPHIYSVNASALLEGDVEITSEGLEDLKTAPPAEFGGSGNRWSPETLLVASVVDCFVLTFRAIARASSLEWNGLHCSAEGKLDRVEHVTRFTGLELSASLTIPAGSDAAKAARLLDKAKSSCLITNSLAFPVALESRVATN